MRRFPSSRRIGRADSQFQFFYTNAVYDQAYKAISSALRAQKGLILLTGDAGTGKTKLMGLISTTLEEQIYFCRCDSLPTTLWELLSLFDDFLVLPDRGSEVSLKLEAIADRLRMWAYRKRIAVLVIDDAHRLSTEVLDHLSLFLISTQPSVRSYKSSWLVDQILKPSSRLRSYTTYKRGLRFAPNSRHYKLRRCVPLLISDIVRNAGSASISLLRKQLTVSPTIHRQFRGVLLSSVRAR